MTRNRWAELLTACPELTKGEISRLRTFKPRMTMIAASVRMALVYG